MARVLKMRRRSQEADVSYAQKMPSTREDTAPVPSATCSVMPPGPLSVPPPEPSPKSSSGFRTIAQLPVDAPELSSTTAFSSASLPAPYVLQVRGRPVSAGLRDFFYEASAGACALSAFEAGAGGDCLFHSVAAGLEGLLRACPEARAEVLRAVPAEYFAGEVRSLVGRLQRLVADRLARQPPEEFLNFLVSCALQQQANPGLWFDLWHPVDLLDRQSFGFLTSAETVEAVGSLGDGGPGADDHLVVTFRQEGHPETRRVERGETFLVSLREEVRDIFATPGNMHWGTATDVVLLAEELGVGLIVFSNTPQGVDNRWIYGVSAVRGDYPFWLLLYCSDNVHFQLAAATSTAGAASASAFRLRDLPDALVAHYNLCNSSMPIGRAFHGGIS
jgi:hypothetical protein